MGLLLQWTPLSLGLLMGLFQFGLWNVSIIIIKRVPLQMVKITCAHLTKTLSYSISIHRLSTRHPKKEGRK